MEDLTSIFIIFFLEDFCDFSVFREILLHQIDWLLSHLLNWTLKIS